MKPLLVDLFCGSFGWSAGWLELGGRVIGFDIDHQPYHGPVPDGAQLVLQDVRTIHGAQFKDAALIVASSPCQEFSYRAMPWKRAKELGPPLLGMELFAQAERIQREAIEAAGHFIPMVQENVRGAQKYVGRARWHYGSFYLWGDVPALMPITLRGERKTPPGSWDPSRANFMGTNKGGWSLGDENRATKNDGGSWFNVAHNTTSGKGQNPDGRMEGEGVKRPDGGHGSWFGSYAEQKERGSISPGRMHGSKSSARKAASARIAKIPLPLAQWIAKAYFPTRA